MFIAIYSGTKVFSSSEQEGNNSKGISEKGIPVGFGFRGENCHTLRGENLRTSCLRRSALSYVNPEQREHYNLVMYVRRAHMIYQAVPTSLCPG